MRRHWSAIVDGHAYPSRCQRCYKSLQQRSGRHHSDCISFIGCFGLRRVEHPHAQSRIPKRRVVMPAFVAFLPGLLAGSLCLSLVTHWITLLLSGWRRNPIDAPLPTTGRVWARVFTAVHPVPWLLLLGLPYGTYRLLTDPPTAGWLWFFAGMFTAIVGTVVMVVFTLKRNPR